MPSAEIWRRISRKATSLKELKESACKTTSGKKLRYKRHLNEITIMRREIRSKNLVSNSSGSAELVSIDGVTLDHDLTNIKYNASEDYSNYKEKTQCHLGVVSKCQYLLPLKNGKITVKLKIKKKLTPVTKLKKLSMKCLIIIWPMVFERTVEKGII